MTIEEQIAEIEATAARFTAASRLNIPVPINEWRDLMVSRIGAVDKKALAKGKIKPVEKGVSVSRQIGRKAKADRQERAWKGVSVSIVAHGGGGGGGSGKTPSEIGAYAYGKGRTLDECPHDGRTILAKQWKAGWLAANKDARKAARKAKA